MVEREGFGTSTFQHSMMQTSPPMEYFIGSYSKQLFHLSATALTPSPSPGMAVSPYAPETEHILIACVRAYVCQSVASSAASGQTATSSYKASDTSVDLEVETDSLRATFSATTGLLKELTNLVHKVRTHPCALAGVSG